MSLTLRPYQVELHAQAKAALANGSKRILIQAPTGSGKTCLVAHMLKNCRDRGYRAWFVVHRKELVTQSVATLTNAADLSLGIVAAGFSPTWNERIQVCMVGSLGRRMERLQKPDLIVIDEAHHLVSKSWRAITDANPDAVHVGLTATPERLDGTGLGECFDTLIQGPSVADLIRNGWLSPYKLYSPGNPNLSTVHTVAGEYNKKELSAVMGESSVMGDALAYYKKYAMGKRAVVFAWSVEASERIAAEFNAAGIPAAHIDGGTDDRDRDRIVQAFRDGSIRVLSNVDIVSEGFDLPSAEACFDLAPTKSLARYLQKVGRVMRPAPGKTALIFDHAGNAVRKGPKGDWVFNHGYPDDDRVWSLDGRPKRKTDRETPVKQCPRCYGFNSATALTCRDCGFKWEIQGRDVAQVEGELAEVDVETARQIRKSEEKSARDYDSLMALGRSRGYKDPSGWARHVMHGRGSSYWAHRNAAKLKKSVGVGQAQVSIEEFL